MNKFVDKNQTDLKEKAVRNIAMTISIKKITRTTLRKFGSIYWPILAGHSVFPVQTAVRYKIPLIIWGAHQGVEQVGMFSHEHEVEMTRRYRKDHDLMGYEADDLLSIFDTLKEEDVWQFRYPEDINLNSVGVKGIYLGNYVRWDPKAQHEQMIVEYGYCTAKFLRTFDAYDYVDCFNYMDLHDQLKLYKHGFSKVTDHASREIRHKRLSREDGLMLTKKHEQIRPKYSKLFLEWLGVNERSLQFIMNQHRNPNFWTQSEFGQWKFNGWSIQNDINKLDSTQKYDFPEIFEVNDDLESNRGAKYITIGQGLP